MAEGCVGEGQGSQSIPASVGTETRFRSNPVFGRGAKPGRHADASEIDALVRKQYVMSETRNDRNAIIKGLCEFLEEKLDDSP